MVGRKADASAELVEADRTIGSRPLRFTVLPARAKKHGDESSIEIAISMETLFISRETFEELKARFEPLSDDEERIEVLVDPSPIISGWRYRIA